MGFNPDLDLSFRKKNPDTDRILTNVENGSASFLFFSKLFRSRTNCTMGIQSFSYHIVNVDDALVDILVCYVLYVIQQLERGLGVQFVGVREPLKLPLIHLF